MTLGSIAFGFAALVAIISAAMVVTARQPVRAVLWFVPALCSVAALIILSGAWMTGALLILVYAGAVVAPFGVLAIMQGLDFIETHQAKRKHKGLAMMLALVLGAEFALVALYTTFGAAAGTPESSEGAGSRSLAEALVSDHLIVLPLTALVLIVALAGAVRLTVRDGSLLSRAFKADRLYRGRTALSEAGSRKGG